MKTLILLFLFPVILLANSQHSMAQSTLKDSLSVDTTIYSDRISSGNHDLRLPQSGVDNLEYSRFINREFSASAVMKKNRVYTKIEVARIVEKDGSVSSYTVKGTGSEAMKAEIVRILKLLPNYKPATRDGKPVRYVLYQPFSFEYK